MARLPRDLFFMSEGPRVVKAIWNSNSELAIRDASGYPLDGYTPVFCLHQCKEVKASCESVEGYTLLPK